VPGIRSSFDTTSSFPSGVMQVWGVVPH